MRIAIDVTMDYQLAGAETVLLTLDAAETDGQKVLQSALDIADATLHRIPGEGGTGARVCASVTSDRLKLRYSAVVDVTRSEIMLDALPQAGLGALPPEALSCLRPSRFCQSDLFVPFMGRRFGHLKGGAKVIAIRDWVKAEIAYVSGSSTPTTTAMETFVSREGVCRDATHLFCALARAAGIPARYTSVYGADVHPPDFHAVAQVWLDSAWHFIDPTGMVAADGVVIIGCGRDAADVAFMETAGNAYVVSQNVRVTRQ
ncbi:transglutaminase-like domain-containing protein [Roseinatronobacter alkalisoli]|uniref:Transglutaminase family protein n=1 Tax=Roseinatronobacter alkalisoli TaxID=3028235 RepID=A0ABT5T739_9RHOB|nr:transglutaminase family protein [Roseinatronobacter sp. HJB301]MDD7970949.1 transglutaminase family protein [Roseinatronobacter sp. HJB301]